MPAPGVFGWTQALFNQPDAYDELRQMSDQAALANATSVQPKRDPTDPNAPPGQQGPPPGIQGQASPEPLAYQTPASWGHVLVDLQQQQEREQGFNQAIGGGFAALSQPRNRDWVRGLFNVNQGDPTKLVAATMQANSQQQGQDRANQVLRLVNDPDQGPQIARAFGMNWEGLKAGVISDPGLVARIAETWGTADEKVRAGTQVGQGALGGAGGPSGAPNVITDVGKQIVSDVGGQGAMTQAQMAWDAKNPGQQTPWNRNDVESFKQYMQKQLELQTSAADFGKIHGNSIDKVTEFQHRVEALKTSPGMQELIKSSNAYKAAIDWIRKNPDSTQAELANAVPDFGVYPPEVKQALAEIQTLRSRDYANAMHSIGQRFSTQEVQNVSKGMDTLLNIELAPQDYNDNLDKLIDETKTVRANSHGAAQDFDTMDPDLRTYVNPTFTKGGRRNVEGSGSEDWADKVKAPQSEIDNAKEAIAQGRSRLEVDKLMRKRGYRPSGY